MLGFVKSTQPETRTHPSIIDYHPKISYYVPA